MIGPERVLFGSDYPQPKELRVPRDYLDRLTGFDEDTVRRVMRDNAASRLDLVCARL